jgi:hypothetical protein
MAGKTVQSLNSAITAIINELSSLKTTITDYHTTLNLPPTTRAASSSRAIKKETADFNEKAATDDQQFVEEQARLEARGGKTRKQSLQEFVLLFFFVAYGLLTVALILLANYTGGSTQAWKTFGLMLFIVLIVAGIIIRYA